MLMTIFSNSTSRSSLLLLVFSLLTACGGGGGGGSDTGSVQGGSASSSEYAKEVADVSVWGVAEAIEVETGSGFFYPSGVDIFPANSTVIIPGQCGGNSVETTVISSTNNSFPVQENTTITFNDDCYLLDGYEVVENGELSITVEQTDSQNGTSIYELDSTFTTTIPSQESGSALVLETCDLVNGQVSCTLEFSIQGGSGEQYELSAYTVSGDFMAGFDISLSFSNNNAGTYEVEFNDVVECNGLTLGDFESGSGVITTPNNQRIEIDFLNCNEYRVTYQGVSETYNY